MKIAILSDIHDHVWNLEAALGRVQGADMLVCCGDLCSPFIVSLLGEGFPGRPIHLLFGNNDGDTFRITRNAARFPDVQIHAEFFETELDGKRIAAVHYDNIACALAGSDRFDAIFYGHNHRFDIQRAGKTLAVNPGTVMGWTPLKPQGERDIPATYAVYDTVTGKAAVYSIKTGEPVESRDG